MNHNLLWEAINEYTAACGGDTSNATLSDRRMNAVAAVERSVIDPEILQVLRAAKYALRSYQYGNTAPALAEEIADAVEDVLAKVAGGGA